MTYHKHGTQQQDQQHRVSQKLGFVRFRLLFDVFEIVVDLFLVLAHNALALAPLRALTAEPRRTKAFVVVRRKEILDVAGGTDEKVFDVDDRTFLAAAFVDCG